jgi:endoglucanase
MNDGIGHSHKSDRSVIWIAIALGITILGLGVAIDYLKSRDAAGAFGAELFVDDESVVVRANGPAAIASQPVATWITSSTDVVADVAKRAAHAGEVPVFVAYNIPNRDCGSYSASDAELGPESYRQWLQSFVDALGKERAAVILEPDALAQLDCLDADARDERVGLLAEGVRLIAAQGSWVYLDAGHSGWHPAKEIAALLKKAGVTDATGFSLNVSNFRSTAAETAYGTQISDAIGTPTHFVIDTSRNGREPAKGEWCNPPGMALGATPTASTGEDLVDAWLWIKTPGLSDGPCNGGPEAGEWWGDYARELVSNVPSG